MTVLRIAASIAGLLGVAALVYWQLVVAEGTYLGPRAVALMYDWVSRRYDAIKQYVPQDERWFLAGPLHRVMEGLTCPLLLDVATGTGRVPMALLRNQFGGERFSGQIIGLDLSRGMLREARSKLQLHGDQVTLVWQDASLLPFDDATFDVVTCLESLEFFPRPLEALNEMVRVLTPSGILILTNRVGREARLLPRRAFPRARFASILASLGLDDVEVRPWQVNYDLASARKPGRPDTKGHGGTPLTQLLRCPNCGGRLLSAASPEQARVADQQARHRGPEAFLCPACERAYPIRQGIVCLAIAHGRGL